MRLLVTGGLGFIGSNFIQKLLSENSDLEILNVDAELDGSNQKNLENLKNLENMNLQKVISLIKHSWKNISLNVMQ